MRGVPRCRVYYCVHPGRHAGASPVQRTVMDEGHEAPGRGDGGHVWCDLGELSPSLTRLYYSIATLQQHLNISVANHTRCTGLAGVHTSSTTSGKTTSNFSGCHGHSGDVDQGKGSLRAWIGRRFGSRGSQAETSSGVYVAMFTTAPDTSTIITKSHYKPISRCEWWRVMRARIQKVRGSTQVGARQIDVTAGHRVVKRVGTHYLD